MLNLPINKKIILFDGHCNLCSSSVQFIIKHDSKDNFRFVALQSNLGQEILSHIGIQNKNIDSIIFYNPNVAYYYKSAAAIEIAKYLDGIWQFQSPQLICNNRLHSDYKKLYCQYFYFECQCMTEFLDPNLIAKLQT